MVGSPAVRLGSDNAKIVLNKLARMLDTSFADGGAKGAAKDGFAPFVALYEDHWSGYAKHDPGKVLVEWRSDGAQRRVSFQLTETERLEWLARIDALGSVRSHSKALKAHGE
jgi:hypothetical protein